MRIVLFALFVALCVSPLRAADKALEIFVVDVEGGQATLFVPPHGQSLLIDTGWGYNAYRDANRIAAAAKLAKIKKIDYVLITHFHSDHVGGVPQLLQKIPVGTFIDHGENRETSKTSATLYREYQDAIRGHEHIVPKPGDRLKIKGLDVTVVSADGNLIENPLPGAGQKNTACEGVPKKETDPSENAHSLGTVIKFGDFRVVDLGDLTWNKELELMCPVNKIGKADLFVVSHHGLFQSNSPALVHAIAPRIAIMDNGAKKGGSPAAWDVVKSSPGLIDLWQLHFADEGGAEHNTSDPFIANTSEADTGFYLKVTAQQDGSFEIYNPRNKFTKKYEAGK
ncbi:MAG TPA: MBL fold metallo-hydrolase [Bryobacteraceae bacterium]|jgi:beta-lactamase superfamily II metal-dependent hydrolase